MIKIDLYTSKLFNLNINSPSSFCMVISDNEDSPVFVNLMDKFSCAFVQEFRKSVPVILEFNSNNSSVLFLVL